MIAVEARIARSTFRDGIDRWLVAHSRYPNTRPGQFQNLHLSGNANRANPPDHTFSLHDNTPFLQRRLLQNSSGWLTDRAGYRSPPPKRIWSRPSLVPAPTIRPDLWAMIAISHGSQLNSLRELGRRVLTLSGDNAGHESHIFIATTKSTQGRPVHAHRRCAEYPPCF